MNKSFLYYLFILLSLNTAIKADIMEVFPKENKEITSEIKCNCDNQDQKNKEPQKIIVIENEEKDTKTAEDKESESKKDDEENKEIIIEEILEEEIANNEEQETIEIQIDINKEEAKEDTVTKNIDINPSQQKQNKKIAFYNNIDESDLGYKHWTGRYTPKEFVLSVNGTQINSGQKKEVNIENNEFIVRYDYDFGYKVKRARGAYEVSFILDDPKTKELTINFSWLDTFHVTIDKAEAQGEEEKEFSL